MHKSSPAATTISYDHCFQQTSEFLNIHLHAWDAYGPKTWYRTSLPSYLLHFFFKRNRLILDGSVKCIKLKFLPIFNPPVRACSILMAELNKNQSHSPICYRFGVTVQIVSSIWNILCLEHFPIPSKEPSWRHYN